MTFLLLIPIACANTTFFDNPDDIFIMESPTTAPPISPTGSITTGTTDETTGGSNCRYEWNCTDWSECLFPGEQTRSCTNIGTCPSTYKIPEITQNCNYIAPETEKDKDLEKIIWKKIIRENQIAIYFILILIIIYIIYKKGYFKKLIKKFQN